MKMQAGEETLEKVVREAEVTIKNADGLHMRPAMQFVDISNQFESKITVSNNNATVEGKSIMQMSMLAATYGTTLKIRAEGVDAQQAIDALKDLIEVKLFGEPAPREQKKKIL